MGIWTQFRFSLPLSLSLSLCLSVCLSDSLSLKEIVAIPNSTRTSLKNAIFKTSEPRFVIVEDEEVFSK